MPNNHLIHYKPGMTLDTPVSVTMAAADWLVFMQWLVTQNMEGVHHIAMGVLSPQITDQVYDQASVKAAKAHFHEEETENPVTKILGFLTNSNTIADELESMLPKGTVYIVECQVCQPPSLDEYTTLPRGELTCGHDGPRRIAEVR